MSEDLTDLLGSDFDPTAPVERRSYDPVPPGQYLVQGVDVIIKNKEDGRAMLKFEFEIMSGQFEGRKIFENVNIRHPNQTAESIARNWMKKLCQAVKHTSPRTNTEDLLWKPFLAKVTIQKDKTGQYGDQNRIDPLGDEAISPSAKPAAARPAPAAAQPTARPAATGGAKPWERRSA